MAAADHDTREWYRRYYERKGADRNDLLQNPEVLFQYFAIQESLVAALRAAPDLDRDAAVVLDVGCGSGGSLASLLGLGFSPLGLHGLELLTDRAREARERYPNFHVTRADASAMPYPSRMFDLVMESTMFVQITSESLAGRVSAEMLRVTKPDRYLLLVDWRYAKPGGGYAAVSRRRISALFGVGRLTEIVCEARGALVPPVGRRLSRHFPAAYFAFRAAFPFLVGSKATLLRKNGPHEP